MSDTQDDLELILGDLIGDGGSSGFDSKFALDAISELGQKGVDAYQSNKTSTAASKASAADIASKTAAITTADSTATNAEAQALIKADIAQKTKADADQVAAKSSKAVADQARAAEDAITAAGFPPEVLTARIKAAQDAVTKATNDANAAALAYANDPKNPSKKITVSQKNFYVTAAQNTLAKATTSAAPKPTGPVQPIPQNDQIHHGGMPTWGWVTLGGIGLAAAGGLGYWFLYKRNK